MNSDSPRPAADSVPARSPYGLGRKISQFLAVLVLVAAAGAVAWLRMRRSPTPASLTLPGGQVVSVRSASYGTNHPAPGRFPFERRLPSPIRQTVCRALGLPFSSLPVVTTPEPALVVWLGVASPPNLGPSFAWLETHIAEADSDAPLDDANLRGPARSLPLHPGMDRASVEFGSFPRRTRRLSLVVQQRRSNGSMETLGTLSFPNPNRHAATSPRWQADPQPLGRTNGELSCSLDGFLVGVGRSTSHSTLAGGRHRIAYSRVQAGQTPAAALLATFHDRASTSNVWTLGALTTVDATGNTCPATSQSTSRSGDLLASLAYAWSPILWDDEIWELHLDAKREPTSSFAPNERLTFEELPLPDLDATNQFRLRKEAHGVVVELRSVVRRAPIEGGSWSSADLSRVELKVEGLSRGIYLDLIAAVDQTGARHLPTSISKSLGDGDSATELGFGFQRIPATATRIRLEFAVHRGVPFVFRVDPRAAVTNAGFGWQ